MKVAKPARINKVIGAHRLTGVKFDGAGWTFACVSFADLAGRYAGVEDASDAIEEFERRATGRQGGEPQKASA